MPKTTSSRVVGFAFAVIVLLLGVLSAYQAPDTRVRVERLLDGPIIGPDLDRSIGQHPGPFAHPRPRLGREPAGQLLSLFRRPQGALHPARVSR